jgi:hypothetical protein
MVQRGKIIDIIPLTENVSQVIVQSKHGDNFFPICFTAYQDTIACITEIGLEKRDVVKINYYLKSKKFENKYFTSAIIENIKIIEKRQEQYTIDMDTGEII